MEFKKGDHVVANRDLQRDYAGVAGTVCGEPDTADHRLPIMFDGIGIRHVEPSALRAYRRSMQVTIEADTPRDLLLGNVNMLQQRLLKERDSKHRARTKRDLMIIEARETLLRELLSLYRDAEIVPVPKASSGT